MAQANDANADDRTRAALLRLLDFEAGDHETSHEIYADDAVLEFPQSGERFVGKRNFLEWRQQCNTGRGGSAAAATSGRRGFGQLRRRRMAVRRQHPRVPRQPRDPRNDLRHAGLGSAHVAGTVAGEPMTD